MNVLGTHHLLRYLIDRGRRKFVLATRLPRWVVSTRTSLPLTRPIRMTPILRAIRTAFPRVKWKRSPATMAPSA